MIFPVLIYASDISGEIKNCLEKTPLDKAIVKLVDLRDNSVVATVTTDENGRYFIADVKPGTYQVEASKPGYYKNVLFDFRIDAVQNYECNIDLLQEHERRGRGPGKGRHRGRDDSEYCFMIGSIEVKSHGEELIPEEPVTTRKVNSGEIEHMQATSLGDVLNLIPGIEKTKNPGLSSASRVGIRSVSLEGTAGLLETYGTTIIVDGNEMSTAGQLGGDGRNGIDLRTIPADNIESVEVISGIPSAEYGNFSNGLIKVKTKSGYLANKLKGKLNPDTKTASYSGGHKFSKSYFDYHFNYGYSERDLRVNGDEYTRLYGKISYNQPLFNEKLNTITAFTYTKTLDSDEPIGVYQMKDYNEGYKASGSFSFDYNGPNQGNLGGLIALNLDRQKDFNEKWVADQVYVPADTVVKYNGVSLSDTTLPGYVGSKKTLGYQVDFKSNLKYSKEFNFKNQSHEFIAGFNGSYESNIGDGFVLDDYWNYYGFFSERRSYSYDQYGATQQYSLFAEDNMKGRFLAKKYNLMLGCRYTAFNPEGFDFSKGLIDARNGEFLDPRFNLQYFISDNLRFRIGAGRSVMAVSLGFLYREPAYFTYLNADTVYVEEMVEQKNPDLKAYTTSKYEASVDWQPVKALGFSLTGYYSSTDDSPITQSYPVGYTVNPDTVTAASYGIYENLGWKDSYGIEFTTRTKRFYNLQFKMNITYRYTESGRSGQAYDSSPDLSAGETSWFKPMTSWHEKVILDYQVNYVNQRLGAWITLDVQQVALENRKSEYHSVKYIHEVNGIEYSWYQGQTYWYDTELYEYGNRWLFNLRITKSLSRKTECSLYINNLFDDRALWINPFTTINREQNPEIYYGLEVSTQW